MNALVIYDSLYGNTETIAREIVGALGDNVQAVKAQAGRVSDVQSVDLLVVGSPTQGGRPTAALKQFLAGLPADALAGKPVAAFDTRISAAERAAPLRLLMALLGYAAPRIAGRLRAKGGRLVAGPEGFVVEDKGGPLRAGEVERCRSWAAALTTSAAGAAD